MVWNFRQSARAYRFLGHKELFRNLSYVQSKNSFENYFFDDDMPVSDFEIQSRMQLMMWNLPQMEHLSVRHPQIGRSVYGYRR